MLTTKEKIAFCLEQTFADKGFVKPGVAELRASAGVSLRTLYRYFPSKEAMVTGALDYRHYRYLSFLSEGEPQPGRNSILHLFHRLTEWMQTYAPNGCLSFNALVAYPGSSEIRNTTKRHKNEIINMMSRRSGKLKNAKELFLLHEGVAAAWPVVGIQAIKTAEAIALKLVSGGSDG
jgi:AcrR family transcriptional regulator